MFEDLLFFVLWLAATIIVAAALFAVALIVITFIFARLARELFASFLINIFHVQANLTAVIKAHKLDEHILAFRDNIRRVVHALILHLRHVHKAVFLTEEVHECAEVDNFNNFAFVDHASFRISR